MASKPRSKSPAGPKSSREKTSEYRARMRARGMRQIQIWVPDVRSPAFKEEARRQSLAVANSPGEAEDQAFVDAASSSIWDDE